MAKDFRKSGGYGDVPGQTQTVVDRGAGASVQVAKASYDPGYDLGTTLGTTVDEAALKYGYEDRGYAIGE